MSRISNNGDKQPCPRCDVVAGWESRVDVDGRKCRGCGEFSSNAQISSHMHWVEHNQKLDGISLLNNAIALIRDDV